MGCDSVRTQLPQKTPGQASVPTLLGNFGQVCFLLKALDLPACVVLVGMKSSGSQGNCLQLRDPSSVFACFDFP